MGVREQPVGLPARWVVRKGKPCEGISDGAHDYMDMAMGTTPVSVCIWCGQQEGEREGWTVTSPIGGAVQGYPDYASAVRHASMGWYGSLDPMQRHYWSLVQQADRVLARPRFM